MNTTRAPVMPSEVNGRIGVFDRFAGAAARLTSRAYFFVFCVGLIVVWAPTYIVIGSLDTWQLIINTATSLITFLLVALLQNTQTRSDQALQHKLNALAEGLAAVMTHLCSDGEETDLERDIYELRRAVGLEEHEGTSTKGR